MIKFKVPIFTEEYSINVAIGKREEISKVIAKTCKGWSYEEALAWTEARRGGTFDLLPRIHPLIVVDSELGAGVYSTLPHEAAHAADYIMDNLGIEDKSGEFRAHAISAVMRYYNKFLKK